jgi:hypothetical protein
MASVSFRSNGAPVVAVDFRPEFLDFQRGIHVGNLEDNQRITRILKLALESRFHLPFVTERWGRGVYWQWIGFLSKNHRAAMPLSSHVSFGCSKFFISMDREEKLFKVGLQIERGYLKPPSEYPQCRLQADWDWHRLLKALKPKSPMERELKRLVLREGFGIRAGSWEEEAGGYNRRNFPSMPALRRILQAAVPNRWAGFELSYAMKESEVLGFPGVELVDAMLAAFDEVTPAMNLCLHTPLRQVSD